MKSLKAFSPSLWSIFIATTGLLSACVTTIPYTIAVPSHTESTADPAHPTPTLNHTTADTTNINAQMAQLQAQVDELKQHLNELQRQQTALSQALSVSQTPATSTVRTSGQAGTATENTSSNTVLQQAQQQYRAGLYAQAVRTLADADAGGDGSADAQARMLLLMQSHQRLNNCESVIHIGNRFASRFARNPQAAEALWQVGQCQWRMQQQDIARDTWRKLMLAYPDSPAAKRAWQRLNPSR